YRQPRPRVAEHQHEQVEAAERERDDQAADDPHHVVAMEQLRDRLDQVDEPDAGEEPAPRAAGAGDVTDAGPGEQAGSSPVLAGAADLTRLARLVRHGFGGSCRHGTFTSLSCCHVSAGMTSGGARPGPRWPAGHRPRNQGFQTDSAVDRTATVARATKMPSQTTRPMARPAGTAAPAITSLPIFTAS